MNHILKPLINEGHVIVYEILVFNDDIKEHQCIVHKVLKILKENKLYLKPEKCTFESSHVDYLGIIVQMDRKKVEAVTKWPTPEKKWDIQLFLGFCNFFQWFIRGLWSHSSIESSNRKFRMVMGIAEQQSFETLKSWIAEDITLLIPWDNGKFCVEADSSDFANGAVLLQQIDGKWYPVAFRSRSLNEVEWNYEIYNKEMMAIMDSLDEWHQYLLGAQHTVEIWTDHQSLQYFQKPQKLNHQQAHWVTELSEYSFELYHKLGKSMGKADALSQIIGLETGVNDNKDIVLLKPELFIQALQLGYPKDNLINEIQKNIQTVDGLDFWGWHVLLEKLDLST
jgi:RNase H-like domain found in reverse transcriptase